MSEPCLSCATLRAQRDELRDAVRRIVEAMEAHKPVKERLTNVVVLCQAAGRLLVAQMLRPEPAPNQPRCRDCGAAVTGAYAVCDACWARLDGGR